MHITRKGRKKQVFSYFKGKGILEVGQEGAGDTAQQLRVLAVATLMRLVPSTHVQRFNTCNSSIRESNALPLLGSRGPALTYE